MKAFYSFPNVKGSRFLIQMNGVYDSKYDPGRDLCNTLHPYSQVF